MNIDKNMIAEDWKKEYEKIILTQKLDEVNRIIRATLINTNKNTVQLSASALLDYLSSLPLGDAKEQQDRRNELRDEILKIYNVVSGDPRDSQIKLLYEEYGLLIRKVRDTSGRGNPNILTSKIQNLQTLALKLNDISARVGDFSQSLGMRVTFAQHKKTGYNKAIDEEGFENLDIGIEGSVKNE